jgi:hypothetical protein
MKTMRQMTVLSIGLALMSNSCASLRPPAEDKAVWEQQQNQEAHQTDNLWPGWLSWLGAFWPGGNPSSTPGN